MKSKTPAITRLETVRILLRLAVGQEPKTEKLEGYTSIVYMHPDRCVAIGYREGVKKQKFFYSFVSPEPMTNFVKDWLRKEALEEDERRRREALRDQPNQLQVGDILYSTWGNEQTNVDFYQVVKVSGQRATVQEIESSTVTSNHEAMTSKVIAMKDNFKKSEKPITRQVVFGTEMSLKSYEYAQKWDGTPKNASHYG